MDVYLDLSLVLLLIEIMVCIKGIEVLMTYRLKRSVKITLILVNLILFFTIKLNFVVSMFLFIILNMTIFKTMSKKPVSEFVTFFIIFFIIDFFIILITDSISIINIYLAINSPIGIIYSLFVPLFGIMLSVASKFVDAVFRLHSYKINCILSKNGKKYSYLGYFDSGNTAKYDNVPIIFCLKDLWSFNLDNPFEIEIETVSGNQLYKAYSALINLEDSKEDYFVYVILLDRSEQFNGCELLLNAYLR